MKKNNKKRRVLFIASTGGHLNELLQLKDKRVVSFPNKKIRKYDVINNGNYEEKYEYTDIVHPSNAEFRHYIEDEIFKYYDMGGETNNE